MSDFVKRLRSITRHPSMSGCHMVYDETIDAAADRIEQLERDLADMTANAEALAVVLSKSPLPGHLWVSASEALATHKKLMEGK